MLNFYRHGFERTAEKFKHASAITAVSFAVPFVFDQLRLTGPGLFIMLLILNEQHHNQMELLLEENEEALAKSRLQLLADQISPHYIYNSLQSIRLLCGTDPEMARDAIDSFSEFLRGNLESLTGEELIPFARELEITQAYLELEKVAGEKVFEVRYQLDTTDFMLPPLVLQPLAENAVQHGAAGASLTEITISTYESDGYVYIEVTDRAKERKNAAAVTQGDRAAADSMEEGINRGKRKSIGLDNVRSRLALQCGGTLEIEQVEGGTKSRLIIVR